MAAFPSILEYGSVEGKYERYAETEEAEKVKGKGREK